MPEPTNKVAKGLQDVNEILSQFIPLIGPFMSLIGLFLNRPDVDPARRRQMILSMKENFSDIRTTAEQWFLEHGYDKDGNELPK
jgi:hypothetical protein